MIVLLAAIAHATPPIATWTFAGNDGGFVHGGSPDLWEWGTPGSAPGSCADNAALERTQKPSMS